MKAQGWGAGNVGHRDQGTLARWLNGSVGASILQRPPCGVLVAEKSEQIRIMLPLSKN